MNAGASETFRSSPPAAPFLATGLAGQLVSRGQSPRRLLRPRRGSGTPLAPKLGRQAERAGAAKNSHAVHCEKKLEDLKMPLRFPHLLSCGILLVLPFAGAVSVAAAPPAAARPTSPDSA